ncbi:MAG: hypothetical protein A4E55_00212 [Pelotomaculum sp. PtaU1.Bin035]|nr:MAG: hypothetical protein A4E55_00212 [Pelotomaculum sp. PtaU1.Bin035]
MGILIITIVIFLIYKNCFENEDFLFLKIIGYFFLGIVRFVFNGFPIPLGYLIFIFFIKPKKNRRTKSLSVYLGIIVMVVSLLIPMISNLYFERERRVLVSEKNLNSINFYKEWSIVQATLDLPENTKLNSLKINYKGDGEILKFEYELITLADGNYKFYSTIFDPSQNVYILKPKIVKQWIQYDKLVPAKKIFEVLDKLDVLENRPNGEYKSYGITSEGEYITYAIRDRQKIFVSDSKLAQISDQELPIEGYWISTYGNIEMNENDTIGVEYIDYLFN